MPKITHLKEFEGGLWARLELDVAVSEGAVHILTDKEIKDLKAAERKAVWAELNAVIDRYDD